MEILESAANGKCNSYRMNYKLSCLTTVIRKWIILTGIRSRPVCLFEQHRIVHSSTEPLNLSNMSTVHSEPSPTLQPQLLLLQTERVQGRPAHRSATVYQYISICRVNILLRGTCQTPASLWDTHRQVQLLPPLTHTHTHVYCHRHAPLLPRANNQGGCAQNSKSDGLPQTDDITLSCRDIATFSDRDRTAEGDKKSRQEILLNTDRPIRGLFVHGR